MRSKQINFFLTATDQAELLKEFGIEDDFVYIDSIAKGRQLCYLETAEIRKMGVERLKIYLVRRRDVELVRRNALQDQPHDAVDVVRSPVIEFMRCYHADHQLRRGRLYVVTAFYEGGVLVKKDRNFLDWAITVIATAQKKLIRDPDSSFYFGKNALELREDASIQPIQ
jgi:hypothetical protein